MLKFDRLDPVRADDAIGATSNRIERSINFTSTSSNGGAIPMVTATRSSTASRPMTDTRCSG